MKVETTRNHVRQSPEILLKSNLGTVARSMDMADAVLGEDVIDRQVEGGRLYINKRALSGTLIGVHRGELFRMQNGPLVALARVGRMHVPFFATAASAANPMHWQAFFGATDAAFITGSGEKDTTGELEKVGRLLDENLIIPEAALGTPVTATSREEILREYTPPEIAKLMQYQHEPLTEFMNNPTMFVRRITGYHPENIAGHDEVSRKRWIRDIVTLVESDTLKRT